MGTPARYRIEEVTIPERTEYHVDSCRFSSRELAEQHVRNLKSGKVTPSHVLDFKAPTRVDREKFPYRLSTTKDGNLVVTQPSEDE
jgi:hypothetical protein